MLRFVFCSRLMFLVEIISQQQTIAIVQFRSCKKNLTQYNSSPLLVEMGASEIELTRVIGN